jgi:hypothetical protein
VSRLDCWCLRQLQAPHLMPSKRSIQGNVRINSVANELLHFSRSEPSANVYLMKWPSVGTFSGAVTFKFQLHHLLQNNLNARLLSVEPFVCSN